MFHTLRVLPRRVLPHGASRRLPSIPSRSPLAEEQEQEHQPACLTPSCALSSRSSTTSALLSSFSCSTVGRSLRSSAHSCSSLLLFSDCFVCNVRCSHQSASSGAEQSDHPKRSENAELGTVQLVRAVLRTLHSRVQEWRATLIRWHSPLPNPPGTLMSLPRTWRETRRIAQLSLRAHWLMWRYSQLALPWRANDGVSEPGPEHDAERLRYETELGDGPVRLRPSFRFRQVPPLFPGEPIPRLRMDRDVYYEIREAARVVVDTKQQLRALQPAVSAGAQGLFVVLKFSLSEFLTGYREGMSGQTTYYRRAQQILNDYSTDDRVGSEPPPPPPPPPPTPATQAQQSNTSQKQNTSPSTATEKQNTI